MNNAVAKTSAELNFLLRIFQSGALVLLLASCVTEKTGGFNADVSPERALTNYLQLARGYLEEDDLANTRRHLANAARIDPDNSELFGIWGLLYSREGDTDLADESFRKALRIDRSNSQTRNNYSAFLYANGRYEEAYTQLELVVQDTEYPQRPQAFENLGLTALILDRVPEAEIAFNRALQLRNTQVRSVTELLDIALLRNDAAAAQRYYNNLQTLQQFYGISLSSRHLLQVARLSLLQGNITQATEMGELLKTNYPDSPEYQTYRQIITNE